MFFLFTIRFNLKSLKSIVIGLGRNSVTIKPNRPAPLLKVDRSPHVSHPEQGTLARTTCH
jgi:hypothetical protein